MKVIGKNGGTLTEKEMEFVTMYRQLDERGKSEIEEVLGYCYRWEVNGRITGRQGNITTVDFSKRQTQEGD